jgi:neutral amino acid transport system permease protein
VTELLQLAANGLIIGSVIALAAVGVSLVYGILRIINFAHGEYLTFGAYAGFVVNVTWEQSIVIAGIAAAAATGVLAIALEFALWRPLRRRRASFVAVFVGAVGLALVMRHLVFLFAGPNFRAYDIDLFAVYEIGGLRFSQSQALTVAIGAVVIAAVAFVLDRTSLGKAMRAVSDDTVLASITGINVNRIVLATWILAGLLAGLAGMLLGLIQSTFDANSGFALLLPVFAAVILGGIGSAYGALAGGLALGLAMEVSTWQSLPGGGVDPTYKIVVAFVLLVAALLVRPYGLFGRARTA